MRCFNVFVSPSLLVPISMSVLRFTMFRRSSNLDSYLGIHLHPLASAYSCLSTYASEHPFASALSYSGFFSCTVVACCIFSLLMDRQLMFHFLVICAQSNISCRSEYRYHLRNCDAIAWWSPTLFINFSLHSLSACFLCITFSPLRLYLRGWFEVPLNSMDQFDHPMMVDDTIIQQWQKRKSI